MTTEISATESQWVLEPGSGHTNRDMVRALRRISGRIYGELGWGADFASIQIVKADLILFLASLNADERCGFDLLRTHNGEHCISRNDY